MAVLVRTARLNCCCNSAPSASCTKSQNRPGLLVQSAASMPVSSLMFGLANCRLKSGRWLKIMQGQRRVRPSRRASARNRRTNISRRAASLCKCSSQMPSSNSERGGRAELMRTNWPWEKRAVSRVNHWTGWDRAAGSVRFSRAKGAALSRAWFSKGFQSGDNSPKASQKDWPMRLSGVFSSQLLNGSLTASIRPAPSSVAMPPSSQLLGMDDSRPFGVACRFVVDSIFGRSTCTIPTLVRQLKRLAAQNNRKMKKTQGGAHGTF